MTPSVEGDNKDGPDDLPVVGKKEARLTIQKRSRAES